MLPSLTASSVSRDYMVKEMNDSLSYSLTSTHASEHMHAIHPLTAHIHTQRVLKNEVDLNTLLWKVLLR